MSAGYLATGAMNQISWVDKLVTGATNAISSNFFGGGAGQSATNAIISNFLLVIKLVNPQQMHLSFQISLGQQLMNTSYSNFLVVYFISNKC
jgi:hypothetical protein